MNPKYDIVHDIILMAIHDLVFGGYALMGDAKERLLRTWYLHQFAKEVENSIEKAICKYDGPKSPR